MQENELFFAYMLRFHRYRGESNIDRSFQYFMKKDSYPESVVFLGNLMNSLNEIRLSPARYLESHSVLPYYRIFCDRDTYARFAPDMVTSKSYYVRRVLQKQNPSIPTIQKELWYCPVCHSKQNGYWDIQIYHQIPEVLVCAEHHCYLKKVCINKRKALQNPENWDVSFEKCTDPWLNGVSEDVKYILDIKPDIDVNVFHGAFWVWFETTEKDVSFQEWVDWVQQKIEELPEPYGSHMKEFHFREYLTAENSAKLSGLGYLILVRIMFGSFQSFIGKISKNE